jgi:hypothetical protein
VSLERALLRRQCERGFARAVGNCTAEGTRATQDAANACARAWYRGARLGILPWCQRFLRNGFGAERVLIAVRLPMHPHILEFMKILLNCSCERGAVPMCKHVLSGVRDCCVHISRAVGMR